MKDPMGNDKTIARRRATRIGALLLALAMLLPLAACGGTPDAAGGIPIPQGMQDATGTGEGYYLFLPDDWRIDHSTGVTIATYGYARVTFAAFASEREPAEYWNASRAETEAMFTDFSMDEEAATTLLGSNAALRYKFSGIHYDYDGNGEKDKYGVTQYISRKNGRLFVLTYMAPYEGDYEQYTTVIELVASSFLFADDDAATPRPDKPEGNEGQGAPAGMKEISRSDIHDCHFYIPTDWVADLQNGTLSAYVSDSDRTSVSLVKNYPTMANTLPEYFENLEKDYKDKLTSYTLLTKEEAHTATTAGLDSLRYVFTATYNGVSYRFMQELFVKGSFVYTFTYTATEEAYEGHLAEAEAMLSAISF